MSGRQIERWLIVGALALVIGLTIFQRVPTWLWTALFILFVILILGQLVGWIAQSFSFMFERSVISSVSRRIDEPANIFPGPRAQRAGLLVWNPPVSMKVGDVRRVEVRLGDKSTDIDRLLETIKRQNNVIDADLDIAPRMRVKLTADPKDFAIRSRNSEDQYLKPGAIGRWDFDVTAKRRGQRELRLAINVRMVVDTKDELVELPSYDHIVVVKIAPVESSIPFVAENWKWIATTIVVPLIGWALIGTGIAGLIVAKAQRIFGTVPVENKAEAQADAKGK